MEIWGPYKWTKIKDIKGLPCFLVHPEMSGVIMGPYLFFWPVLYHASWLCHLKIEIGIPNTGYSQSQLDSIINNITNLTIKFMPRSQKVYI